jgi:aspartokinase-like uncharacterized kinase
MSEALTVVKVGGSLYDLPDLRCRLQRCLDEQNAGRVLLVPGGGPAANVVRDFDSCHALGEETAHWLALRALTLNAHFLAELMHQVRIVDHPRHAVGRVAVLDAFAFSIRDEREHPDRRLPHTWAVTSDAVAARAAVAGGAARLVLLKSVTIPQAMDWTEAGRLGFVDAVFAEVIRAAPALVVEAVNLRA